MQPENIARLARLLIALAFLTFVVQPRALSQEAPTSVWWFPLGDNEARRENPVATGAQTAADIQIKWRTSLLAGAGEIFVGALTSPTNSLQQQILGVRGTKDSIVFLDMLGRVERVISPISQEGADTRVIELSGLFDIHSRSIEPDSRPNTFGVALRRPVTSSTNGVNRAYGLLLQPDGRVVTRVGITASEADRLIGYTAESNRTASLYPVAAFSSTDSDSLEVLALLSQDGFVVNVSDSRRDSTLNSLRVYRTSLTSPTAYLEPRGTPFRIAPRTYRQQPAIRYLPNARQHVVSLATVAYDFPDTVKSGLPGSSSRSNEAWSLHLRVPVGTANVSGITEIVDTGIVESGSLFADIIVDRINGPEQRGIRLAYDALENRPETGPRIRITEDNQNSSQGVIPPAQTSLYDGFEVLSTDLDGMTPGSELDTILVNNPGREFVVSRRLAVDPDSIQVMIYRLNERVPINNISLGFFTQQGMRGRIAAAGDLVSDAEGRMELLHVSGRTISVLQLRPYNQEEKLRPFNPDLAEPFQVLARFELEGTVLDVAIADVEGDGRNDIVASTEEGTYLIGTVITRPFRFDEEPVNTPILCPDDSVAYSWVRATNGGGAPFGIRVEIIGPEGFAGSTITDPNVLNNNRISVPVRALNLSVEGEYRIVVRDGRIESLSDTGAPFLFRTRNLGTLSFDVGSTPLPIGSVIKDTIALRCIDGVELQSSSDGENWMTLPQSSGSIEPLPGRDSAVITALIQCSPEGPCGSELKSSGGRFFRLQSLSASGNAQFVEIERDSLDVHLDSPESEFSSRVRTASWIPDSIPCTQLRFTLSDRDGRVEDLGIVGREHSLFRFRVPDELRDTIRLCVECEDEGDCIARSFEFVVPEAQDRFYVAPNPFSPNRVVSNEGGLVIVYTLENSSIVSIQVVDRSRSLVREVVTGVSRDAGRHRATWDGTNGNGQMVANGTYFCVIELSNRVSVVLPFLLSQ